ncbi:hypothetical protein [Mycoplasma capricolum]|uniref:hypothetical protein n=1 Tax=Mycoplasma capricolum TaxID=2095 RepID=UPI003DA66FD1
MFGSIKNLIKGLIHLPRIIQNPVSYTLWWFLLPILAIPAALAIIVEFFARDFSKSFWKAIETSIFVVIKNLIKGLIHLPRIIQNLVSFLY